MAYKTFGGGTYSLGASIGSTDTSILLTSFTEPVSGTPYTFALLGTDIVYATIAPGTSSSEFISFTSLVQNGDGTCTLGGVTRGLAKKYPFTTSATFKLPHSSQTTFIISNPPQLYEKFVSMVNDETIAGIKTFSSFPITPSSAPTTDYQVSNKKYVDDAVIAGAVKATNLVYGISKLSVAAASASDPIVVGTNDNRVSPVSLATVTSDIVAALAGTGTPNGTTGKYVTNDDTSATSSANKVVRGNASGKIAPAWITSAFGGTGTDGALAISSGTTTIDLSGAEVVIKNYTSISITGTGKLAFTNPHANGTIIILKSQGDVTITSGATCIDASGLGGIGGTAKTTDSNGVDGTSGLGYLISCVNGLAGTKSGASSSHAGGTTALKPQLTGYYAKYFSVAPGGGGGSGGLSLSNGAATSGAGGRGGGGLVIECGGAWNFTTASGISVAGTNGGNGSASTSTQYAAGGGSGGGGGIFLALYSSLTANSGTVVVNGGIGGTAASGGIGSGLGSPWGSSGGASVINSGTTSLQGSDTAAADGVAGGNGISIVAQNFDIV